MVELRRNFGRKNSSSFRMKQRNESKNRNLWYRYLRWFLWVSLSLYLFSSYLLGSSTTSLQKITFATPATAFLSRAIIEPDQPFDRREDAIDVDVPLSMRHLKIYVYDLPARYNEDWLSNPRCSNHLFAAEVAIHRALLGSDRFRTLNPWEADFFFVPVYVSCDFSAANGFPDIGHARTLLASAVQLISTEQPFWNRTRGADHVFVATHDFGACFHTLEDVAIADGIPSFLRNSIILQTFGVKSNHPCQEVENVGREDAIWRKFNRHRDFYIKRKRSDGYQSEIVRSVFCLCPLGWAPWSPRVVESVALGCVPVIIADDIQLPFPASVPWSKISLRVAEKDVQRLDRILRHVASTNLSAIQRNLWEPSVQRALLFNDDAVDGDATWQVLDALSRKLQRSFRGSKRGVV